MKLQLEAPNAEPGSCLRVEMDIVVEDLVEVCAFSVNAGSGGWQGVVVRMFFCTTTPKTLGASTGGWQLKQTKTAVSSAGLFSNQVAIQETKAQRSNFGAPRKMSGQAEGDTQTIQPL